MGEFFVLLVLSLLTIATAFEPPTIIEEANDTVITYKPGIPFKLPCDARGDPKPNFRWHKNGQDLIYEPHIIKSPTSGNLTFQPIKESDAGYFRCYADNGKGVALTSDVLLRSASLGNFDNSPPVTIRGRVGAHIKLPCEPVPSTPKSVQESYSWARASSPTSTDERTVQVGKRLAIDDDGNLHILNAAAPDATVGAEIFKCVIFNADLDVKKGGSYKRLALDTTAVNSAPRLVYSSPDTKVLVGEVLDLRCFFAGNPTPEVDSWTFGPKNEQLPPDRTERVDQRIRIKPAKFEDEGTYRCRSGSVQKDIRVTVESKPSWHIPPAAVTKTVTRQANFVCQGRGKPPPTVSWFINGEPLVEDTRRKLNDKRDNLTISDLTKADIYVVQCNVSNTNGYMFKNAFLNVVDETIFTSVPKDQSIEGKERVIFPCGATVDPGTKLEIDWLFNDRPITYEPDRRYKDVDNSLVINLGNEADKGDSFVGTYTCVANNGVEPVMADAKLTKTSVAGIFAGGIEKWWWIILVVAILLILIIVLLCCVMYARQSGGGEAYPVDENERKAGHDPEKDLKDSGFQEFTPGMEPHEGGFVNPAATVPKQRKSSLTGSLKMGSDDEASLNEYGDIDTGKFNEDGSFIGEYNDDDKKDKGKGQILETEA